MKFSILSISELASQTLKAIKRFPFVIICAVIGTICGIWYADLSFANQENYDWLSQGILVSFLGISFLFAINMYAESREWPFGKSMIAGVIGIVILMLYYFLPSDYISSGPDELGYRFLLLALTSHLLVSIAPFIQNGSVENFWEYNKRLLLTIITSGLYSAVLFIGLSVALLSIDNLLGFNIDDESYFQLWIFIVGIFNTLFFFSRVPFLNDIESSNTSYPKPLKLFVQYVLIPLVTVYILILYSYLIKIIVQWELPNGWVANLVLSFSIAGIFSLLLLHPIKDEVKNNWMRFYSKLYFRALVPLVVLLFVSIGTRISEYGVTINRFLVATLAVWLAGIVIYFIFSKAKNIKVIPISLAIIAFGVSFGPMSAFSVSERSQLSKLVDTLRSNGLLNQDEKVVNNEVEMEFEEQKNISSVINYLVSNHGVESMQPVFNTNLKAEIDTKNPRIGSDSISQQIMSLIGLEYITQWENEDSLDEKLVNYYIESPTEIDIEGYSFFIDDYNYNVLSEALVSDNGAEWLIEYERPTDTFSIKDVKGDHSISTGLTEYLSELSKDVGKFSQSLTVEDLTFEYQNDQIKVKIVFNNLLFDSSKENPLKSFRANIFITEL